MDNDTDSVVLEIVKVIDELTEPGQMIKEAAVEVLELVGSEIEIRLEALREELESEE